MIFPDKTLDSIGELKKNLHLCIKQNVIIGIKVPKSMPKILTFDFCTLSIYDNYTIAIIDQGVHVHKKMGKLIIDTITPYYQNSPFVYITNRKYSYSVDPTIYLETSKIHTLLGLAVVSIEELPINNVKVEKLFANKPFKTFKTIEDAISWAQILIKVG